MIQIQRIQRYSDDDITLNSHTKQIQVKQKKIQSLVQIYYVNIVRMRQYDAETNVDFNIFFKN